MTGSNNDSAKVKFLIGKTMA